MANPDACPHSIQQACPDLKVTCTGFKAQGQKSDAVVVNGEFSFRFSKHPALL